jgi:hypothetical protein
MSPNRVSWAAAPAARRLDGTPAVPAYSCSRCTYQSAAEVGRGTNGLSTKLSIVTGSVPKHPPKVLPTPTAAPLKKEESPDDPPRP